MISVWVYDILTSQREVCIIGVRSRPRRRRLPDDDFDIFTNQRLKLGQVECFGVQVFMQVDDVHAGASSTVQLIPVYQMLKRVLRLDLFSSEDLSVPTGGVGVLAYWLAHPNEFEESRNEIEGQAHEEE